MQNISEKNVILCVKLWVWPGVEKRIQKKKEYKKKRIELTAVQVCNNYSNVMVVQREIETPSALRFTEYLFYCFSQLRQGT